MMESYYWKAQIRRKSMSLERRRQGRRWPSRSIDFFERELMIGFFCVRKLIESKKLTDACTKHTLCVLKYPLKGKITGLHDFIEFDQLYNLSLGEKCDFNVEFVANLLIHSFFTFPSFDEESNKVDGIWVTSDRQKGKALYRIPLNGILQTLRRVADDKIKEIRWTRDHTNGEWVRLSIT